MGKVATLAADILSLNVEDETTVTIESNATAFYGQIAGLAEDKIGYPIREICSNAWDVARGDFDVSLPTEIDPVFRVRDYGTGLSHADMKGLFTKLYASTKRESVTELGGWGVGRFSPFAYLLSESSAGFFQISSWYGGMVGHYVMTLNPDGIPSLKLLGQSESDERPGLEISFAVRQDDIQTFHKRAASILWSFDPRPRISPMPQFNSNAASSTGTGWSVIPNLPTPGPHVRVGCVMYPIDLKRPGIAPSKLVKAESSILFEAPIGSVRPTLSREDLAADGRTIETLNNLIQTFEDEVIARIQSDVSKETNFFSAAEKLRINIHSVSNTTNGRNAIREAINWRGHQIPQYFHSTIYRSMRLSAGWSLDNFKAFDGNISVSPESCVGHTFVIEHNTGSSMKRLVKANLLGRPVVWVRCLRRDRDRVLAAFGNPETIINLDDFKIDPVDDGRSKTMRKRSVMVFGNRTINRETIDIDTAVPQIYAYMSGYGKTVVRGLVGHACYNQAVLQNCLITAREVGAIPERQDFIIVRITDDQKIPENWTCVSEWLLENLMAHFKEEDVHDTTLIAETYVSKLPAELRMMSAFTDCPFKIGPKPLKDFFKKAFDTAKAEGLGQDRANITTSDRIFSQLKAIGHTIDVKMKSKDENLSPEWEKMKKTYPILSYFVSKFPRVNHYWDRNSRATENAINTAAINEYGRLLLIEEEMLRIRQEI